MNTQYSYTIEFPMSSISPKLYKLLTGLRAPGRLYIAYYAREWSRTLTEIFQKH